MADEEDEVLTRRESYYNHQRSSLRSDRSSNHPSRSRPLSAQPLDSFYLDLDSPARVDDGTAPSPVSSSPAPNVPYTRSRASSSAQRKGRSLAHSLRGRDRHPLESARRPEEVVASESWLDSYELVADLPAQSTHLHIPSSGEQSRHTNREHGRVTASRNLRTRRSRNSSFFGRLDPRAASGSQLDITALPAIAAATGDMDGPYAYRRSKPTPSAQRASRAATELYTISYLIFFAIWGTLARLGLQALTFYPGAPIVFSVLWANVAGTFIMGFLTEDQRLFRAEWGNVGDIQVSEPVAEPRNTNGQEKARHGKVKKTIPLYIGLATGFCGSFTSFSSFIRDIFLALSNDLRSPKYHPYPPSTPLPSSTSTVSRDGGYSFMALVAIILVTIACCFSTLKLGAHLALFLHPWTPTLPFRLTRRILDPVVVVLAWCCWIAAILLTIFPPNNHTTWRSQALFACVFAPPGCLLRYYISLSLNPLVSSFPMGTFAANIFGTAVLGMAYDLQHVSLHGTDVVGGSVLGCQVLQGIMDGFCGCLTTVSTWMAELSGLGKKEAYVYGGVSVAAGLGLLVVVMGSVRWTVGWGEVVCMS
jgi:CrcB protein